MGKTSFLQDFKAFAMKGNVIDMAVGVIIGGAFGKIVSSVVADVIMPPIGLLVGGVNFTDLKLVLKPAVMEGGKEVAAAVTLNYGNFLQVTFDFLIIAFSVFLFVRLLSELNHKKAKPAAPAAPPAPSKEELLLTEIRDLLKNPRPAEGASPGRKEMIPVRRPTPEKKEPLRRGSVLFFAMICFPFLCFVGLMSHLCPLSGDKCNIALH